MKASIIIPSYNACERLRYNLLSLNNQSCSKELYEAVVIDNGSEDGTWSMLQGLQTDFNMKKIRLYKNNNRSFARNTGIAETTGDIIIFSDSDMISSRSFVESHIKEHCKEKTVVCGDNWDKIYTFFYKNFRGYLLKNLKEQMHLYKVDAQLAAMADKTCLIDESALVNEEYEKFVFSQEIRKRRYQRVINKYGTDLNEYSFPWSFFITNNCSAAKADIIRAGGFDEGYNGWGCEDLDLGYRLYKEGCSFVKRDIKSVHQEHPIKENENGIKNIYSFTKKYDCPDIILYYFSGKVCQHNDFINEAVKEMNLLEAEGQYPMIVDICKDMLKLLRDRSLREFCDNNDYIRQYKNIKNIFEKSSFEISKQLHNVSSCCGCNNFVNLFEKLTATLLKIKMNKE